MFNIKKILGLEKSNEAPLEIGVIDNKVVLRFNKPTKYVQLTKEQGMELIVALTQKLVLIKK